MTTGDTIRPAKKRFRPKRLPQRTCVGCLEVNAKREMIRLVRTESGTVEVDPTGKKAGRGAYLCKARSCWEAGLKKNRLEHTLRTKTTPENRAVLLEYGEMLPTLGGE